MLGKRRMMQLCLHPAIAAQQRHALGYALPDPVVLLASTAPYSRLIASVNEPGCPTLPLGRRVRAPGGPGGRPGVSTGRRYEYGARWR